MFKVYEGGNDETSQHHTIGDREQCGLLPGQQPAREEENSGQQFDEKIAGGDGGAAVGALATEGKPCDERDVEKPRDGIPAVRTVRRGGDNAEAARHAVNAYIEEAPHHASPYEKDNGPEMKRYGGPDFRIKGS